MTLIGFLNKNKIIYLGHIHGTLWVRLKKLENLVYGSNGKLRNGTREEIHNDKIEKPLKGLVEAFTKLRNDCDLNEREIRALTKMIEEFTTVSLHKNTVGKDVARIASEVNVHHHTRSCRKYNNPCRFKYPKYPSHKTIVAKPLKGNKIEKDKKIKKIDKILTRVHTVLEDSQALDRIWKNFSKDDESKEEHQKFIKERVKMICEVAGVSIEDYYEALSCSKRGYNVVQRRDIDETMVNSYNEEWIRAWNGNMDLQICLDFFAVITYITDYYSKDDTGTMKLIKTALKDNECKDVKDQMKVICNTFLKSRQMGEAEAVYRLIPSMNLRGSNVTCQWVPTEPSNERSKRFRKATEAQMNSGIDVFQLEGHEGLFFEVKDIYSKYLRRPDNLENICFAQFAKMFRSKSQIETEGDFDKIDEEENETETIDDFQAENEEKFNFVMSFDVNKSGIQELPKKIRLKDIILGEPPTMMRRRFPAALRFHKKYSATDHLKFMFSEVILYHPHTSEFSLEEAAILYEEGFNGSRKVDLGM